jgi:hypothetical protein
LRNCFSFGYVVYDYFTGGSIFGGVTLVSLTRGDRLALKTIIVVMVLLT